MKKIILILFTFFIVGNVMAKKTETRVNGGPNGYGYVKQTCDHGVLSSNCSLLCENSGTEKCIWRNCTAKSIYGTVDMKTISNYVFHKIISGELDGQAEFDGIIVTWHGTDLFNLNINVNEVESSSH